MVDGLKMDDWQESLKIEKYVEVAGLTCRTQKASFPSASLPFIGAVA